MKIIILDFNQIMLSNLMMQMGSHTNMKIEEDLVRHMVLNSIRMYNLKFKQDYGQMVIACDNRNYWRKKVFAYYKANRKKDREKSDIDWNTVFEVMSNIRSELKEYFPYPVIDVDGAEADDVIASLVHEYGNDMTNRIMILSADKDFIQLHQYLNVEQYDPIRKKKVSHNNPAAYLKEHILRGDSGDGVPNFLSSDNCLVIGERQKPISSKKLEQWIKLEPQQFETPEMQRNYNRNRELIDLTCIPADIRDNIIAEYKTQQNKSRSNMFNYFMKYRLKHLMEHLQEF